MMRYEFCDYCGHPLLHSEGKWFCEACKREGPMEGEAPPAAWKVYGLTALTTGILFSAMLGALKAVDPAAVSWFWVAAPAAAGAILLLVLRRLR